VYPIKKIACNAGRPLQAFILISVSWPLFYSAARRAARIRSPLIASVGGSMGLVEMLQVADRIGVIDGSMGLVEMLLRHSGKRPTNDLKPRACTEGGANQILVGADFKSLKNIPTLSRG
jgi:hypothetical protein